MVTDVVSTRFVDSERCLGSHKITTVTLNEIRGARSPHLSSLLWSKGKCSRLTYANRFLNPLECRDTGLILSFFLHLSRYFFSGNFLKRIQFSSLRIKIYCCKELLIDFIFWLNYSKIKEILVKLLFLKYNIFPLQWFRVIQWKFF